MIICERCGRQVPDTAAICPACGTISSASRTTPTGSGQNPPSSVSYEYSQGYGQQSAYAQQNTPQPSGYPPQPAYPPPANYPPQSGYGQPYNQQPAAYPPAQAPVAVNINVATPVAASSGNTAAVVVEVILSIFNIYGVGWLMAGETTTGIILLICSLVLYWPIVIGVSVLTLGLGLFCIEPLSIGAIILNAILLNNKIKQKSMMVVVQTSQSVPPYPYPRQ